MKAPGFHRTCLLAVAGAAGTLVLAGWFVSRLRPTNTPELHAQPSPSTLPDQGRISPEAAADLLALEEREANAARTSWATETLAQECGRTFDRLWDALNAASNRLETLATFNVREVLPGDWSLTRSLPHGIRQLTSSGPGAPLAPTAWRRFVQSTIDDGWRLTQIEFRHRAFEVDASGHPDRSKFQFAAHLVRPDPPERAMLGGLLSVEWARERPTNGAWSVNRIDASHLSLLVRSGAPPFQLILEQRLPLPAHAQSIDPLIIHDFDGDGASEIFLAGANQVFRRGPNDTYSSRPLLAHPPDVVAAAALADFDQDGAVDLLVMDRQRLVRFRGSAQSSFEQPPILAWPAPSEVQYPMVLTAGDVDNDGDLDVFLGQYRDPYEGGATPTPFHDANNGHPSFLLINDGSARFQDETESRGLTSKRWRRCYSASFADLDGDRDLDLLTVSDFAGLDLYRNDGTGHFREVTREWVDEPHAFGMAHVLTDFNADGALDLLMIGMTSPTVDRLDHLNLARPEETAVDLRLRTRMTHGNRLYLGRPGQTGFSQGPLGHSLANTGWSWGAAAADFDLDGFPDLYVANGLESRESVVEYEPEYWLHDRFVGSERDDPAAYLYFRTKIARTRGRGQSYGGYEKNRLCLNLPGEGFVEVGFLFGVALEQDSRNVVADDLDGDGRPDLIVTSFERWPAASQVLRVFANQLPTTGHWISFHSPDRPGQSSPIGARVDVRLPGGRRAHAIVTGDSHRSQHPATAHFGLGEASWVEEATMTWPDGTLQRWPTPAINQRHTPPQAGTEGPPPTRAPNQPAATGQR